MSVADSASGAAMPHHDRPRPGSERELRRDCDADVGEESGIGIIRNRRLTRSPGEPRRAT